MSDSEEEILVYAELEEDLDISHYKNINVSAINSKTPIIQMDDTFFTGKYENPLGTYMFFKEGLVPKDLDPLFDKISEKHLEYLCQAKKFIKMEHAYITPNENILKQNNENETQQKDMEKVTFKTFEEGIEKFKQYWTSIARASEENSEAEDTPKSCTMKPERNAKKTLETALHDLNRKFIRIKKKEKLYNNKVLHSVLKKLLDMMRNCDDLFNSMHPKLEFMGSYFEGLRVGHPTEFDINVCLKIPVNYNTIILDSTDTMYDYTYIIMPSEFRRLCTNTEQGKKGFQKTLLWCDKKHRLSVSKFRSWMQSVVYAALNKLPLENGKRLIQVHDMYFEVQSKISGPAINVTILQGSDALDIDLVPTFAFTLPKKPINSKIDFTKREFDKIKQYFVVPKPTDDDLSWRLTFPFQERVLISNKHNLKIVIKLIKLLRDSQGYKQLASYYIKTLFLWEISQSQEKFWQINSLSYLVIYMMTNLQVALSRCQIRNYWCPDHNLISRINAKTCENWSNRLSNIIRNIKRNEIIHPNIVIEYFIKCN